MYKLILASQSPRRKELLKRVGIKFVALPPNISETPDKNLNLEDQILKIAEDKALACIDQNKPLKDKEYLILSADTMVIVDGVCYGKPENKEQAKEYLKLLSGREHQVKTALFLLNCKTFEQTKEITTTDVYFRTLLESEINAYVESGEPMDKAGGYGIQGIGGSFIKNYRGPFDNVVGLSLESLNQMLRRMGWKIESE